MLALEGRGVATLLGLVGAVEALLGGGGMGSSSVVSPSSAWGELSVSLGVIVTIQPSKTYIRSR